MPDIFLYQGTPNPPDVILSDPTVVRGGSGNVTVNATGNLLSAVAGIVLILASANVSSSGGSFTSNVGAVVETGDANVAASGNVFTSAAGTVTVVISGGSVTVAEEVAVQL